MHLDFSRFGSKRYAVIRGVVALALVFVLVSSSVAMATTTPSVEGDATVVTGDAGSELNAVNNVNFNEVNTEETENTEPPLSEETASTTELVSEPAVPTGYGLGDTLSVDADLENDATAATSATTTAETGDNSATADGTAVIETGTAYAGANVINVANTNIVNSDGLMALINDFSGTTGDIDLREGVSGDSSGLPCSTCEGTQKVLESVNATNTATVNNSVLVRANSGNNSAEGDDAFIGTGNAYAAGNILNVVNTNIVDSTYILMVFNSFGSWGGDLIFPNADFFKNLFFAGGDDCCTQKLSISADNTAAVDNNVATNANTGDNTAVSTNSAIATGNAVAMSNVVNQVNTNLINHDSFVAVLRVSGDWTGGLYNVPDGIFWKRTPQGIVLYSDPDYFDEMAGGGSGDNGSGGESNLSVSVDNEATITNNVGVYALTGANQVTADNAGAILTGNAYAASNVINVANTNVLGRNWTLAILNIFGNWSGNLSFGQPDLWLGTSIEGLKSTTGRGSPLKFHYTIWNRGDADAHDVVLRVSAPDRYFSFEDSSAKDGIGSYLWNLGTLSAGELINVTYEGLVGDVPYGHTNIPISAVVQEFEPDANSADNEDIADAFARDYGESFGGPRIILTPDPKLVVTKTNNAVGGLLASTTVTYTVTVNNEGGQVYHAALFDTIKNGHGQIISEQVWDLEEIAPNEEIIVTYDVFFNGQTQPDVYTNYAQVRAIGRNESLNPFYGQFFDSNIASSTITVYSTKPISWEYSSVAYAATSTTEVISATTMSEGGEEGVLKEVPPEDVPFWLDPSSFSLPPYVIVTDTFSRRQGATPQTAANLFSAIRIPWSSDLNILTFIAIVVLLYLARQSYPQYKVVFRSFFTL